MKFERKGKIFIGASVIIVLMITVKWYLTDKILPVNKILPKSLGS